MKKLIAMLLCIAMVAAFGVQAFAIPETDAEKKEQYDLQIKIWKADKQYWLDAADMVRAAERVYMEKDAALAKLDPKDEFYSEKVAEINADAAETLAEIKASDPTLAAAIEGDLAGIWTYDPSRFYNSGVKAVYDGLVTTYLDATHAKLHDADIAHAQYMSDKYADKIAAAEAEAAEKAAQEAADAKAAKLYAAAEKAANAAVKDPKTAADWLLWNYTFKQYLLENRDVNSLSAAKKAANDAKSSIAVAQKGALAAAKAAVTEAQIVAYNNMQTEITKAVGEYVDGVYAAINEYVLGLYE